MGNLLTVQDYHAAREAFTRLAQQGLGRLKKLWADAIYKGDKALADWAKATFGWVLEVVEREPGVKGFQVLPKRWVVERTFAWLGRQRRLSKDYEGDPTTTETWIYLTMTRLMARRLAASS